MIIIFALLIVDVDAANNEKILVNLVKCVDGDTAVFDIDGTETKFRFLAIDTPESVHPKKDVEVYGKEASEYTCELLNSAKNIYIQYDEKGSKTDKYGRNLAWIWLDDSLLQSVLVRNGYATVAYVYYKYAYVNDLCATQQLAIDEKINIWSETREIGYCSSVDFSKGKSIDIKTYNVTFKNQDNENIKTVLAGERVIEPDTPEKLGYTFVGWYLGDDKFDFSSVINENITLDAKYDYNYYYFIYALVVVIVSIMIKNYKRKKK